MNLNNNKFFLSSATKIISFIFLITILFSCTKAIRSVDGGGGQQPPVNNSYQNGVIVVNEGDYNWGNASITFINQNDSVEQNVFETHNDRKLGDVAESMQVYNGKGYIVVNNSNRIEVVSLKDFKSAQTITGFYSPRFMAIVDSTKAYVTNMEKDVSVVDLTTSTIQKVIPTVGWTESLLQYNTFLFVSSIGIESSASSQRNAKILIIDTKIDKVVDSIKTGKEPICMVMDKKEKIWVLCTGGYDHYESASLLRIDPSTRAIDKVFTFPNSTDTPSRLCINSQRDTLYFLSNGIYQMPVASTVLPSTPFIPANGHLYYGLGIQPSNGNIFVSDAKDYVQKGTVYQYNQITGSVMNTFPAGIIPGSFCFPSSSKKK